MAICTTSSARAATESPYAEDADGSAEKLAFLHEDCDDDLSDSADSADTVDSDCDSSFSREMTNRVENAEREISNLEGVSRVLEARLTSSVKDSQKLKATRIKLLYKNMAAAVLGRLLATGDEELQLYTSYCLVYVRRLLELQDRQTVTKNSKHIVEHLKTRVSRNRTSRPTNSSSSSHGVLKVRGVSMKHRAAR